MGRWTALFVRVGCAFAPAHLSGSLLTDLAEGRTADECEAFLAGGLVEYHLRRHEHVPRWEWTNLLAHGSDEALGREANGKARRTAHLPTLTVSDKGWRAARAHLAALLLDRCEPGRTLADLQRTVLVPVELELASSRVVASWEPREWVAAIETTLVEHGIA